MATLQTGQTVTLQATEGESWTVTPTLQAQISSRGVSGGQLTAPATISAATTYGPFNESGTLTITALRGPCDYTGSELSSLVSGAWFYSDYYVDAVVTGLALPTSGGLSNTVTAGVAYITGSRISFGGQAVTFAASSDNYVDAKADGTLQVSAVAISAGAPAVAVNGLRLGYVRTGASTVSSTVSTGKDSLGNWMSNRLPSPSCRLRSTPVTTLNGILSFGAGTEVLDNNAMHSTSTNSSRITCVRPGTYNVFGAVNWAAGSNLPDLTIYKNGADANLFAQTYNTASTVISAQAGGDIELAAGDYIELRLGASVLVYAAYLNVRRVV